jgi:long-chain fatty acid transport protein
VDSARGIIVGASLPVPFEDILKDRVGFALGVYVPTAQINQVRAPLPGTPYFALLEDRHEVIGIQVGLGFRLTDRWSVGAGLLVLAALTGTIDVETDTAGRFSTASEEQLIASYAPVVGVRYRASDALTLGATFHARSQSSFDILVETNLGNVLPIKLPEIRIGGVAQYDPMAAAFEAAWHPMSSLMLSAQVGWEHWSAYPQPTLDPLDFVTPQASTNFSDTIVPRVGVEWTHPFDGWDLALRGGYFLAMSPASDQITSTAALLDNTRHVFTAGVGVSTARGDIPLHIDAFFQAHVLQPRHWDSLNIDTSGNIIIGGIVMGVDL